MVFEDRVQAGRQLAKKLEAYAGRKDVLVLGIPRGGVPVAFEVARVLRAPLDIFLSRKLGVPGQEELAFGALTSAGVRVLDQNLIRELGLSQEEIDRIVQAVKKELERRERVYRGGRAPLKIEGKVVLLVDDGIATGSSMLAAIKALRQLKPSRLVVAVPVAPFHTCKRMKSEVDEIVCVYTPETFYAIGQFYEDFSQITDQEVTELLDRAAQRVEPTPPIDAVDEASRESFPASDAPGWIRS